VELFVLDIIGGDGRNNNNYEDKDEDAVDGNDESNDVDENDDCDDDGNSKHSDNDTQKVTSRQ